MLYAWRRGTSHLSSNPPFIDGFWKRGERSEHSGHSWWVPVSGSVLILTSAAEDCVCRGKAGEFRFQLRQLASAQGTLLTKCTVYTVLVLVKNKYLNLSLNVPALGSRSPRGSLISQKDRHFHVAFYSTGIPCLLNSKLLEKFHWFHKDSRGNNPGWVENLSIMPLHPQWDSATARESLKLDKQNH